MSEKLLDGIHCAGDVKKLNISQLPTLASEVRQLILTTAQENGGHLASSLGAVDAIIALYYVYDFPEDKLIFDVGHQAYCSKILSGRKDSFSTIRKEGGISGFPCRGENECDAFTVGHAGTSISASLGYLFSRDCDGENYNVVDFVGDGSFFNGENLEALFSCEKKPRNFLVVFNDNGMSISKNTNGLYKFFSKISLRKSYNRTMNAFSRALGNSFIGKALKKIKYAFKRSLSPNSALDMVGLKYLGVYDGHDIPRLVALLKEIKRRGEPAFLHIKTQKGRGYAPAEDHAEYYHGVGKAFKESCNTFSDSVSSAMCNIANKDGKIVAITAGMKTGTGLSEFAKNYPDRFKDVGICEEFAVTYAAGMAAGGYKPYVFIYSTFMQRAYDQIISDVCLQKLPVVLCLDRAGAVGGDGQTHQGAFDISFLRHIPNLKVLAPKDESELSEMLVACSKIGEPVAIRYPNGFCAKLKSVKPFDWKFETLRTGKRLNILAVGARMNKVALDVSEKRADLGIGVINARIIKPLDEAALSEISSLPILTLEENTISGGFGESVSSFYRRNNIDVKLTMLGFKDQFIAHATTERQLELNGLDENSITEAAEQLINAKKPKKRAFFSII